MATSPLVFTYNNPGTNVLNHYLVNQPSSPLAGNSTVELYTVQSSSINLQGVTLTVQFYDTIVAPATPDQKTSLLVETATIIASTATDTLGTLSYGLQLQNPVPGTDPLPVY